MPGRGLGILDPARVGRHRHGRRPRHHRARGDHRVRASGSLPPPARLNTEPPEPCTSRLLPCRHVDFHRRKREVKVGRSAPCPCGSGLKYKKCCLGKVEALPANAGSHETTAHDAAGGDEATAHDAPSGVPSLSAYSSARLLENAQKDGQLDRRAPRRMRDKWTISKVASLTTAAIETRLTETTERCSSSGTKSCCVGPRNKRSTHACSPRAAPRQR